MKFSLTSPSKLNLRLEVLGRREDGFHLLKMLNVETSLADEIELEITRGHPENSTVKVVSVPKGDGESHRWHNDISQNIAGRAAVSFLSEFGLGYQVSIQIRKSVPTGTGLGGGSSNGASVIRGLVHALIGEIKTERGLSLEEIAQTSIKIAKKIGSDVPYFLTGGACLVEGVGDIVTPISLPAFEGAPIHVVIPTQRINTAELYSKFRLDVPQIIKLGSIDEKLDLSDHASAIRNDLEPSVVSLSPVVGEVLNRLRAMGECTSVTGSGSACFVLLPRLSLEETNSSLKDLQVRTLPLTVKVRHNPLIQLN